ncbi:MAG: universal stress protein [Desulfobacterales bacterium]|nr:universal stress protein [Desulfobacterales bacterium]MDD4071645.1 universal stress protein [Desulfobacterales bacterium]MDD4391645.1 universal stress protein [Desulfobacterales bacterium]
METRVFHIFRNTPLGRETLLQSIYLCDKIEASPVIYLPESTRFLMYFENDVVQIDLDNSYLTSPETARLHVTELFKKGGVEPVFFTPKQYTASTLPDIPTNFDFMCCPRSISDLSSKIGLGYIGPRVRRIIKSAHFPVLITSPVFKKWNKIMVFFGGSSNALNALKLGLRIKRATGIPLDVFTHTENKKPDSYKAIIEEQLGDDMASLVNDWKIYEKGKLEDYLYDIPHDALVILGAYGHSLWKNLLFGSKMEKIQSTILNNLLIVGPKYTAGL